MSTSADELRAWFERGELTGKRYMIVATDTFDYEDYPVYTDAPVAEVERLRARPMTKVMEVYDLRKRFDARRRVWDLPEKDPEPDSGEAER